MAAVTNYKLGAYKNKHLFSQSLKSLLFSQNESIVKVLWRKIYPLPLSDSGGYWHSLVYGLTH